ncbi:hypothetical protein GOP47_0017739 [Adiantum capillus-veneris]|uniref:4Fe-4S ferredoxin-type domain-containing protein n=1 Tax=Adiantum capillus-veneris TaxID=13818 RepID=A0A9D4ZC29_ADICA|nr:hypothetical protein GOP47_0017739 [Adiantum capillus-veneris]
MAGWQATNSLVTLPIKMTPMQPLVRTSSAFYACLSSSSYQAEFRSAVRCIDTTSPYDSLLSGGWVKLICGASFEDVADVRNLSLVYTLAGVDCIDCAADPSVVKAVREGVDAATGIAVTLYPSGVLPVHKPWIMVSINDDEDVHFRKAVFDPSRCPTSCARPCEHICPASAIMLSASLGTSLTGGVLNDRCYGCGRCISVCPLGLIGANSYTRNSKDVSNLLNSGTVDAVEIHTNARHMEAFRNLWQSLEGSTECLKLIAISLPDVGDNMLATMWDLYNVMKPTLKALNLWQLDGRPMSGDIGAGATKAAVRLAAKVAAFTDRPPGFLQLAGGTNFHTVKAMAALGLFQPGYERNLLEKPESERKACATIAGVAYGGYARKILRQILASLNSDNGSSKLEDHPVLFLTAVKEANYLVAMLKEH